MPHLQTHVSFTFSVDLPSFYYLHDCRMHYRAGFDINDTGSSTTG